ncbi:hypothetical protein BSZ35_14375 [Salinibacter sp. 10B]|uniref:hypothetical protein n=1 Tax=Salinibacter sp. 10B TaxID=1923971 RepID=UPI000CF51C1C|nr:hypothetical protein [Salinibacter sp. 10B]PQJ35623.1 hypothetical protein BSZ35_14375 [Salinibacter sp. 10B]
MNVVLAVFVVVGFAATIEYFDLPLHARNVTQRGSDSLAVLRDDSLSDLEKEEALQRQARRLFGLLGILAGGSILALGAPLGIVWLLGRVGIGSFERTLSVLQRLDFLGGTILVGALAYLFIQRLRTS